MIPNREVGLIKIDSSLQNLAKNDANLKKSHFWQVRSVIMTNDAEGPQLIVKDLNILEWITRYLGNAYSSDKLVHGQDLKTLYKAMKNDSNLVVEVTKLATNLLGLKKGINYKIEITDGKHILKIKETSYKEEDNIINSNIHILNKIKVQMGNQTLTREEGFIDLSPKVSKNKLKTEIGIYDYKYYSADQVKTLIANKEISLEDAVSLSCRHAKDFESHVNMFITDFGLDLNKIPEGGYPNFRVLMQGGTEIPCTPLMDLCVSADSRHQIQFLVAKGATLTSLQKQAVVNDLTKQCKNESDYSNKRARLEDILGIISKL